MRNDIKQNCDKHIKYTQLLQMSTYSNWHCAISLTLKTDIIKLMLVLSQFSAVYNIDLIGHFRASLCLCFKARLSAKTFSWWLWFAKKMKLQAELIFIWKVSHLNSFWNRGIRELGNGLLPLLMNCRKLSYFSLAVSFKWNTTQEHEFLLPIQDSLELTTGEHVP